MPLKICTRVVEDIRKFVFDMKIFIRGVVCVPVAVVPPRRGCYKSGIFCLQDWQDAIHDFSNGLPCMGMTRAVGINSLPLLLGMYIARLEQSSR